ncbi:hypothetical protein LTR08_002960 [Meristemomyces frigidus]|nr:hypothetical protein LTR08_002960 [Meristemomyces frigidus]
MATTRRTPERDASNLSKRKAPEAAAPGETSEKRIKRDHLGDVEIKLEGSPTPTPARRAEGATVQDHTGAGNITRTYGLGDYSAETQMAQEQLGIQLTVRERSVGERGVEGRITQEQPREEHWQGERKEGRNTIPHQERSRNSEVLPPHQHEFIARGPTVAPPRQERVTHGEAPPQQAEGSRAAAVAVRERRQAGGNAHSSTDTIDRSNLPQSDCALAESALEACLHVIESFPLNDEMSMTALRTLARHTSSSSRQILDDTIARLRYRSMDAEKQDQVSSTIVQIWYCQQAIDLAVAIPSHAVAVSSLRAFVLWLPEAFRQALPAALIDAVAHLPELRHTPVTAVPANAVSDASTTHGPARDGTTLLEANEASFQSRALPAAVTGRGPARVGPTALGASRGPRQSVALPTTPEYPPTDGVHAQSGNTAASDSERSRKNVDIAPAPVPAANGFIETTRVARFANAMFKDHPRYVQLVTRFPRDYNVFFYTLRQHLDRSARPIRESYDNHERLQAAAKAVWTKLGDGYRHPWTIMHTEMLESDTEAPDLHVGFPLMEQQEIMSRLDAVLGERSSVPDGSRVSHARDAAPKFHRRGR